MTGARPGSATSWQRLFGRLLGQAPTVFVVPDARIARTFGLDLAAAGFERAATPRHAAVLLVAGDLPNGLSSAAAVVYAQMPRPRAILAVGASTPDPLLPADIATSLDQAGLAEGARRLRDHFAATAWSPATQDFTAPILAEAAPASAGGMDHAAMGHSGHQMEAAAPSMDHTGHRMMDAGDPADQSGHSMGDSGSSMDHSGHMMGESSPSMHHGAHLIDHSGHMMDHGDHTMDHSGHMMDGGGFMSMVAMTQDLPRSRDGLPMEWVATGFGPLFPGLPGGLAPVLTLDGDTVAGATVTAGIMHRGIAASLRGPVATLPGRLARLDPLTATGYRLLAYRAIANIGQMTAAAPEAPGWIGAVERERAMNHLGWLAAFGELLGDAWLADRAARLHLGLVRARDIAGVAALRPAIDRLMRDTRRASLLRRRLAGVGVIDRATALAAHGPVARASGVGADIRGDEPAYQALGFSPVLHDAGDAFARLRVRLDEIGQSLDLVAAAGSIDPPSPAVSSGLPGAGMAAIETPRGQASLHIEVSGGDVQAAHLQTPSAAHVSLVADLTKGLELGDALAVIASLDLSPWELDP